MSMRFLLFTLYAPMGAFGEIATGELRMSAARPGAFCRDGVGGGCTGHPPA